ncbi:MAG TPA: GAF domain-containing protein [Acidimicrobiales bacterium]|nr:GAF domain-containing protein [Acidimicrobiales bacterium]
MPGPAWSTQQLAEFLAFVSAAEDEAAAALAAVERAAEALDAEVAAIVSRGRLVSSVGYREGRAPVAEIEAVIPGAEDQALVVPGVGPCPATAVRLEHPPGAVLVIARSEPRGLTRQEASLLNGIARVTSMTMRMLSLLDEERVARQRADHHAAENRRLLDVLTERQVLLERLVEEQAALRRVATLVAGQTAAVDTFEAVAEEVTRLFRTDGGAVCRFEPDGSTTIVASASAGRRQIPAGTRIDVSEGGGAAAMVLRTGAPARLDSYEGMSGSAVDLARDLGIRSSVGGPIVVDGRLWGAMVVLHRDPLPPDSEERMANFTELIATAIGNTESRAQLAASRARVVAAADEARRRIERDLHDGTQQRLVSLGLELRAVEASVGLSPEIAAQLAHMASGLDELVEELQEITRGIHPAILSRGGLAPAIKMLARRSTVPAELDLRIRCQVPEHVGVALYYVASEALTNVAKHARASGVQIRLRTDEERAELVIRDDGIGGVRSSRGSGLLGLRDRVEALGGTIEVASPEGAGTTLTAVVPTVPPDPESSR